MNRRRIYTRKNGTKLNVYPPVFRNVRDCIRYSAYAVKLIELGEIDKEQANSIKNILEVAIGAFRTEVRISDLVRGAERVMQREREEE